MRQHASTRQDTDQTSGIRPARRLRRQLVISISSAGQVTPLARPPYFVLIEKAWRDEGTSLHCARHQHHGDPARRLRQGRPGRHQPHPVHRRRDRQSAAVNRPQTGPAGKTAGAGAPGARIRLVASPATRGSRPVTGREWVSRWWAVVAIASAARSTSGRVVQRPKLSCSADSAWPRRRGIASSTGEAPGCGRGAAGRLDAQH
jgi:hypothetical protein